MVGHSIGRVQAIARYPVKSLQGEALEAATVALDGVEGDRRWGIFDPGTGHVLTAKRVGQLLEASARLSGEAPVIELPDGTVLEGPGPQSDRLLGEWLGRSVELRQAGGGAAPFRMSFNVDDEEADVFEWVTPTGYLGDLAPVHVLTTSSLASAGQDHPEGDWSPHRFRPTLVVESHGEEGFVENGWVGKQLAVGDVVLEVTMPTIRCSLPTKAQPAHGIERDLEIFKSLARTNDQNLGCYATVRAAGEVAVGDPVVLRDP